MKLESELSRHIYEYYETRILSGFYHCGDPLPSIHKVSSAFKVSSLTVRTALAALEQQGYVTVDARKTAKVIYQTPDSNYRKDAAAYFVPRADGILDLTQGGELLLKPCWDAALLEWEKGNWASFQEMVQYSVPNDVVAPHVVLYIVGLSALHNKLLINLYWEIIHYIRFPFLLRVDGDALYIGGENRSQQEMIQHLNGVLVDTYRQHVKELSAFIDEVRVQYSLQQVEPIPFRWRVYRQQPQMRYSLASHIIRGILYRNYPVGSKLPSLSQMAKLHGVSVNTVRRTLALLDKMGVVESHRGKRATIRMEAAPFDVDDPEIRGGLRLYLDALQIIELTIQPVMLQLLEAASPQVREELRAAFTQMRERERSSVCFEVIFWFVEKHCTFALVKECYSVLLDLITWGFPLTLYRLSGRSLHGEYLEFIQRGEQHLREHNWAAFSLDCRDLMAGERQQASAFIAQKRDTPHPQI